MKKMIIFIIFLVILVIGLCACEPAIKSKDISALPDKLVYVQYYDKELDLTGGKVTYQFENGQKTTYNLTSSDLRNNVNFNIPGHYNVFIDFTGTTTEFNIQVIPYSQADWLDENIKQELSVREKSSIAEQDAIKMVINGYLHEITQMHVEFTSESVSNRLETLKKYLDSNSAFAEKCPAVIEMDFAYLFHYNCMPYENCVTNNEFKYIYVTGNNAEVCVYEDVKYINNKFENSLYQMHNMNLVKNNGVWYIDDDITYYFYSTSDYYDEQKALGLSLDQIVEQYKNSLSEKQ